ncbi:unnamed protein product, partial [Prunus brigantina]
LAVPVLVIHDIWRLTWMVLKSAGAGRAQSLHILLRNKETSPQELLAQVADTGGDFSTKRKSGNAGTKVISYYRDRVNTLFVVATLFATVTFAAAFTMPGGYNNSGPNEGMATLLTKYMFQAFVIFNTIAMYSAIC